MTKPFFSIIIPTLNEEFFIAGLLKTLAGQKFKNFEVIIVDGNSKDNTHKVAEKFADKLPGLVFYTVGKRNVSYQRNFGAAKARGNYLVFFDADVKIPRTFLKDIKANITKGADFLTTYLTTDSPNFYDRIIMQTSNLITEIGNVIGTPFAIGASTIIKKQLFKRIGGYDEKIVHAEDYNFTKKAKEAGINLTILKNPQLVFSLRRYEREGRLKVIRQFAKSTFHLLTKGPITKELFDYKMGGGYYVKVKNINKPLNQKVIKFLEKKVIKGFNKLFDI